MNDIREKILDIWLAMGARKETFDTWGEDDIGRLLRIKENLEEHYKALNSILKLAETNLHLRS